MQAMKRLKTISATPVKDGFEYICIIKNERDMPSVGEKVFIDGYTRTVKNVSTHVHSGIHKHIKVTI